MRKKVIPIIIPHFQEEHAQFADLIDSLRVYIKTPFHIIVVDDHSLDGSYERLLEFQSRNADVTVLRNSKKNGWGWGMWANVGAGLTWAYENLSFKYAFKIDCDALIINYDLDCFFEKMFSNPKVGIVAHFQNQQNHRWIWSLRISRKFKELAKKNGYFRHEDEEQCFWSIQEGVEAFSYKYIAELIKNSNFDEQKQCGGVYKRFLGHKGLWEGPLFVVLCYAYGFEAIDMPVIRALFQKDELHKIPYFLFREMGLRAIHPLKKPKSANDINLQVRAYFQGLREKDRLIRTQ